MQPGYGGAAYRRCSEEGLPVGALFTDNQSANGRRGRRIKEYVEATALDFQIE